MKKKSLTVLIILASVICVVLVGAALLVRSFRANAAGVDLQTEAASLGEITATIGQTGTVRARQSAELLWRTSGSVETVNVSFLDQVNQDAVLASLQYSSLSQNIMQAKSDLSSAQVELDQLYANFDKDKAEAQLAVINAQEDLKKLQDDRNWLNYPHCNQDTIDEFQNQYQDAVDRVSDLEGRLAANPDNNLISVQLKNARQSRDAAYANYSYCISPREESEINKADTEIALAQATLDLAQQNYAAFEDGLPDRNKVESLQMRIETDQVTLQQADIRAPFDGTVTAINIMPGDQVTAGTSALRIDDLTQLLVDVAVSEIDINSVQVGQDVQYSFDAIPGKTYHGEVVQISNVGNTVQGVVEFNVTTSIRDADASIKPGMTAITEIVLKRISDALLVPNQAVRIVDGQRVVYILETSGTKEVAIELGAQSLDHSEVLGGDLKVGDQIILNPPENVLSITPGRMPGRGLGQLFGRSNQDR